MFAFHVVPDLVMPPYVAFVVPLSIASCNPCGNRLFEGVKANNGEGVPVAVLNI
jgi:hypothetical protein